MKLNNDNFISKNILTKYMRTKMIVKTVKASGTASKKVEDDFSDLFKLSQNSLIKLWDNKSDDIWNSY